MKIVFFVAAFIVARIATEFLFFLYKTIYLKEKSVYYSRFKKVDGKWISDNPNMTPEEVKMGLAEIAKYY